MMIKREMDSTFPAVRSTLWSQHSLYLLLYVSLQSGDKMRRNTRNTRNSCNSCNSPARPMNSNKLCHLMHNPSRDYHDDLRRQRQSTSFKWNISYSNFNNQNNWQNKTNYYTRVYYTCNDLRRCRLGVLCDKEFISLLRKCGPSVAWNRRWWTTRRRFIIINVWCRKMMRMMIRLFDSAANLLLECLRSSQEKCIQKQLMRGDAFMVNAQQFPNNPIPPSPREKNGLDRKNSKFGILIGPIWHSPIT